VEFSEVQMQYPAYTDPTGPETPDSPGPVPNP
jgi:hypothetical protein